MKNAIEMLSKVSGLTEKSIRDIAAKVMENKRLLSSCSKHSFDTEISKRVRKCSKCNGTVNVMEKIWYEKGLKHGTSGGQNEMV